MANIALVDGAGAASAVPLQSNSLKQVFGLKSTAAGGAGSLTITNAQLQAYAKGGPLLGALNASYVDAAGAPDLAKLKRTFGEGSVRMWLRPIDNAFAAGVVVQFDATATTKPAITVSGSAVATALAYLDIEFVHSVVK